MPEFTVHYSGTAERRVRVVAASWQRAKELADAFEDDDLDAINADAGEFVQDDDLFTGEWDIDAITDDNGNVVYDPLIAKEQA